MTAARNIGTVREVLAHWERGDFRAAAELFDPELEFETFMPDAPDGVFAHGFDELAAFTRDWLSQWREYRVAGQEVRALDSERVFASVRQIGTGIQSGAPVESPGFSVWTLRGGLVTKLSLHYDEEDAVRAAESGST